MPGWTAGGGGLSVVVQNEVVLSEEENYRWVPCNSATIVKPDHEEDGFVGFISPSFSPEYRIGGVAFHVAKPGEGSVRCEIYSVDRYNMPVERLVRSVGVEVSVTVGVRQVLFPAVQAQRCIIGLDFSSVEKMPEIYWMISSPNGYHSWPSIVLPTDIFLGMPGPVGKRLAPALSIKVMHGQVAES